MNRIALIICCAMACTACSAPDPKSPATGVAKQAPPKQPDGQFFDFDDVYYYFSDFDEAKSAELDRNQTRSELDSLKLGVLLDDIPKDVDDTSFIGRLEEMGYHKKRLGPALRGAMHHYFREKPAQDVLATACIYVYRDVLIFKKAGKVVGTAKICFKCLANEIRGTGANTDNFGQDGDYASLERILRGR